jgi:hypothetical protein
MTWTLWGLAVQTIAGFLGAHAAATAAHEHRFGFLGHSLVGLVGGALSGTFLQTIAATIVNGGGAENTARPVDIAVSQFLCGAVVGGILMFAVGFLRGTRTGGPPGM